MELSFEWLIDPIKPADFFKTYYERQPLLIARHDPSRFDELLSIAAIDRFLATTSPRHPDVFVVDAARKLSADDYTLSDDDTEGMPRPAARVRLVPHGGQHLAEAPAPEHARARHALPRR